MTALKYHSASDLEGVRWNALVLSAEISAIILREADRFASDTSEFTWEEIETINEIFTAANKVYNILATLSATHTDAVRRADDEAFAASDPEARDAFIHSLNTLDGQ